MLAKKLDEEQKEERKVEDETKKKGEETKTKLEERSKKEKELKKKQEEEEDNRRKIEEEKKKKEGFTVTRVESTHSMSNFSGQEQTERPTSPPPPVLTDNRRPLADTVRPPQSGQAAAVTSALPTSRPLAIAGKTANRL